MESELDTPSGSGNQDTKGLVKLEFQYIENIYPGWYRRRVKVKPCACTQFGGKCVLPLEKGEPLIKVLRRKIVTKKGIVWKVIDDWRPDCFKPMWRQLLEDWYKQQNQKIDSIDAWWLLNEKLKQPPGNRSGNGGPPTRQERYSLSDSEAEQRKKIILLRNSYKQRLRILAEKPVTPSSFKSRMHTTEKLIEMESWLASHGGVPNAAADAPILNAQT